MCADFRHQKRTMPLAHEPFAHDFFAQTVMILPAVVHERNTLIESFLDYSYGLAFRLDQSEMVPTQRNCRNFYACPTERSARNLTRRRVRSSHQWFSLSFRETL